MQFFVFVSVLFISILQAHRVVLAAVSEYFRAMFTDMMRESNEDEISIHGITARGIRSVINYIYTSKLELDAENVIDVLSAANYVQINSIVEECSNYLQSQIDIDNCVDLLIISETFSLLKLQKSCYRFICLHLYEFSISKEFSRLECDQLKRLLTCDFPVNCTENTVLRIILNWLNAKQSDAQIAQNLLTSVHLSKISQYELNQTLNDIFQSSHSIYSLTMQLNETQRHQYKIQPNGDALINSRGMELSLINVGGFRSSTGITNEIVYYLPSDRKWQYLTSIPHIEQCNYGTAVFDNEMYIVGGCYNVCLKEYIHPFGFRYNPITNKWSTIKPMQQDRCRFSLNALGNKLFAAGGVSEHDDDDELNSESSNSNVEVYDPLTDVWRYITPMPEKRSQHAGATDNKFLYVSGGLDRQRVLPTFWRYDPKVDAWASLPDMLRPRADHSMFVIDNKVYACGGWYEEQSSENRHPVETIDEFDFETNIWKTITSIPTPKYHAGIVAIDKIIYIVGGLLSQPLFNRASSTVEYFDIKENEWKMLDSYPQSTWECTCVSLYIPKGKFLNENNFHNKNCTS